MSDRLKSLPSCPLCGRALLPGPTVDEHHLLPRSHGGTATVALHRICHQAIHATLSEQELARDFQTIEALRQQPALARFIAWVRRRAGRLSGPQPLDEGTAAEIAAGRRRSGPPRIGPRIRNPW